MTAPELLPCPFCGDTESLMVDHMEGTVRRPAYRILCDNCGASTNYSDRGDHVEEWNRRDPAVLAADPMV
jgi:Lar family restriction alleviation protein